MKFAYITCLCILFLLQVISVTAYSDPYVDNCTPNQPLTNDCMNTLLNEQIRTVNYRLDELIKLLSPLPVQIVFLTIVGALGNINR
jgi:hypothetical protein